MQTPFFGRVDALFQKKNQLKIYSLIFSIFFVEIRTVFEGYLISI